MTSKEIVHNDPYRCALVIDMSKQTPPLDKFVRVMSKIKFINKKGQTGQRLSQNGIIVTIRANLELQKIMK